MKKLVALAVIIACLSVAYYFAIFLPSTYPKKPSERLVKTSTTSKEDLEMQEKCAKAAKEFFNSMGTDDGVASGYECHYNKRVNKCFILIKSEFMANFKDTPNMHTETLYDVLANKQYGILCYKYTQDNKPISTNWNLTDINGHYQGGQDQFEWERAIRPFMEE